MSVTGVSPSLQCCAACRVWPQPSLSDLLHFIDAVPGLQGAWGASQAKDGASVSCTIKYVALDPPVLTDASHFPLSPFAVHGFADSLYSSGDVNHAACEVHQRCSPAAGGGGGKGVVQN